MDKPPLFSHVCILTGEDAGTTKDKKEERPTSEAVWLLEGGALLLATCSKEREKTALAVRVRLVRAPALGTDWLEVSVRRLTERSAFSLAARPIVRRPASLSLLVRPPSRHFFMALAPRFNVVTLLLIVMVGVVMSGPIPHGHTPSSTSEISISSSGEPRSTASVRQTGRGRKNKHGNEKQDHADEHRTTSSVIQPIGSNQIIRISKV
ncbi:hypothetical protein EYF80_004086 [Liparis tanakae]|uniref:Uncharacterized protein n=1 Tax=Liparis tanakae TaxID=230148 RepID=A0A4Z2J6M7_9TELE|nr:hypothetical protein EYF80_004086 [Liparis tanakae]